MSNIALFKAFEKYIKARIGIQAGILSISQFAVE